MVALVICGSFFLSLKVCFTYFSNAVSYTHLDVYKRQVLTSLGALFCGIFSDCTLFDPMVILIVPLAIIAVLAKLTAFVRLAHCYKPVSYTHLRYGDDIDITLALRFVQSHVCHGVFGYSDDGGDGLRTCQ